MTASSPDQPHVRSSYHWDVQRGAGVLRTGSHLPFSSNGGDAQHLRRSVSNEDQARLGDQPHASSASRRESSRKIQHIHVSDRQCPVSPSDPPSSPTIEVIGERNLEHDLLPPRHRRPRTRQLHSGTTTPTIAVEKETVYLYSLSPNVTERDIAERLSNLGFKAQAFTRITVLHEEETAIVEFAHPHLAQAAFSLLRPRPFESDQDDPVVRVGVEDAPVRPGRQNRAVIPLEVEIIDLTNESDDEPMLSEPQRSCDPYAGLDPEVYDDPMESDSDSESAATTPSRLVSTLLTEASQSTDDSIETQPEKYDLSHLNATARDLAQTAATSRTSRTTLQQRQKLKQSIPLGRHRPSGTAQDKANSGVTIIPIPKSAYNHPRRVLGPESADLPLMTVSMRGDLQFFHRNRRYRLSKLSIPNNSSYRHVVDAVMAGNRALVAYTDGPSQVSVVSLDKGRAPAFIDLDHRPHRRAAESGPIAAVNCLAVQPSNKDATHFFTGGFDKRIRRWSVTSSRDTLRATSEDIFGMSTIPEALACSHHRARLLIATSKKLLLVDLNHLTSRPATFKMSNPVHQIHLQRQAPDVVILEVDNLDFQIQLYDQRKKGGFDRVPDAHFGARLGNGVPARLSRGDSCLNEFTKGFDDGTVRIWDYRNVKNPMIKKSYQDLGPIVHTSYLSRDIVSYGKQGLVFLPK